MPITKKITAIDETTISESNWLELEMYINEEDRLYINVGILSEMHFNGSITLNKEDAKELANELLNLLKDL